MGTIYSGNVDASVVIKALKEGKVSGLQHGLTPESSSGSHKLWPDYVTDGEVKMYFEGNMLLVWGAQDVSKILRALAKAGFHYHYMG
jgi:hypothetical protein